MYTNIYKTVIAAVTIVCVTILLALGAVTESAGIGVVSLVLGYILGNGVAATRRQLVEPIISRRPTVDFANDQVTGTENAGETWRPPSL